ncbi:alpha-2-macroglobulin family protein [Roseovarius salinarum]|uniref:alpha-2-macroglobulin family protein n=1 Tax=Roseovarius salinarum TaxID=1981892 RepID=UPI000C346E7F|nr:alpha-2-macroglobulin family protein [Roseovarius salinarum]
MLRRFLFPLVLCALAGQAAAQSPVPERRLVVSRDVDFFGADLQPLFDTSFEACQRACLSNPKCRALTFNTRKNACFPKKGVSERKPYDGALSAVVLRTDPQVVSRGQTRAAELDFLSDGDIEAAMSQARGIGARHPGGDWDADALLRAAQDRRAKGDMRNAMRWMGAAVARTDAADQWVEYGRLSLAIKTDKSRDKRNYAARALSASVNGYLRAPGGPAQVNALTVMARALERRNRGRDMIDALRLAQSIQPRQQVAEALDEAVAKYGFRTTDSRVDSDSATPRICAEFSEPLVRAGTDYTPYVRLPDAGLVVQAEKRQLCIDGVEHGQRYSFTFRSGLPAASGEKLHEDVEITHYVRDRAPEVRFPGRTYVLPRAAGAAVPVETVNIDEVALTLRRISDRNLLRTIQEDFFGRPLSRYQSDLFDGEIAETVWTGTGQVENTLNKTMTTRLPLESALADQPTGIYALTARVPGRARRDSRGATQWFVLTDLGLTTMKGTDGLHVFVRGLADAQAREGVTLTLLSRSNRELATARTGPRGHARFAPGLTRGTGGAAPAMVLARAGTDGADGDERDGAEDFAFLSLTDPAFDLSDRGVSGRAPAPPVDVFLTTDRGAYRAGEVIRATALARDGQAQAVSGMPLTAILTRPDGVEYSRHLSAEDTAGGHVFEMPVGETAPRGTWQLQVKGDVDAPALASRQILVEDFLPERIDFEMSLPEGAIRPGDTPPLTVEARYLFGAPGAGLKADGSVTLRPRRKLEQFPGYLFGRHDDAETPRVEYLQGGKTGDDGRLTLPVQIPEADGPARPYEAQVVLRVKEGSGRPVEREITRMLAPAAPVIGIRPGFDGVVPEGTEAAFDLRALGPDLAPVPMRVKWTLNRIETRYQWYERYGNWNWEPVTTRRRVATGETTLGEGAARVSAPVDWGRYELVVERVDGPYAAASVDFHAGWHAPADATRTPDTLEMSLDKPRYRGGETATLRMVPRHAGTALVTVLSNRVIDMTAVEVTEGENRIELPVTDDWGSGAYVTAQVIRPMDVAEGRNPARSLGLSHAKIAPGEKRLDVSIDAPDSIRPRGPLEATVEVDGLTEGDTGHVTLAAVDVGILNLTGFEAPDPAGHYFGQRRLGVEIRDLYGRLIDGMSGAEGRVRSGGDAGSRMERQSPPPTEELVAFFEGPLTVGPDGTATARFDIPDFNGTVRLMAVAWSRGGVGQADRDVLVRDPVVTTATLPRFLAPGDESRLTLEITHADGPAGRVGIDVTAGAGVTLGAGIPPRIDLAEGETHRLSVPLHAEATGDHAVRVALTTPAGKQLLKTLTLPVRRNDPEVAQTRRFTLAPGDGFTLDDEVFAGLRPGTGSAVVSAGPLARMNAPALIRALDRFPYGCTEQVTSQAMPLLYFGQVAQALGIGDAQARETRVQQAIDRILTRQSSGGSFGLWRASSGDFWLDAYVTDFLSRARAEGYAVPDRAFTMAMDNLRNRVNYAPDFDEGGEDIAYALMVLAREGAARMGDLRYYADVKAQALATPLAAAQLGAALAAYGESTRADRLFRQARAMLGDGPTRERPVWRADYGTALRDRAGVLALAVQSGSDAVDPGALAAPLTSAGPEMSTQEQAWTLLAARALISDVTVAGLTVDGQPVPGPFVRTLQAGDGDSRTLRNTGARPARITLTTRGVPRVAPEAGGYGFGITRRYFDMEGNRVDPATVEAGTRLVTVLRVTPFEKAESRLIIDDPLPAGLEIDNPNLLRSGDIASLGWLDPASARHSEFRSDRFIAAVDWRKAEPFELAYIVRAVTPGRYHHPAATVEDMYRPRYHARTGTGRIEVTR